ncbi:hypothetical protein ACQ86F_16200 [Streptomyces venezuelae ATCC 10712]
MARRLDVTGADGVRLTAWDHTAGPAGRGAGEHPAAPDGRGIVPQPGPDTARPGGWPVPRPARAPQQLPRLRRAGPRRPECYSSTA